MFQQIWCLISFSSEHGPHKESFTQYLRWITFPQRNLQDLQRTHTARKCSKVSLTQPGIWLVDWCRRSLSSPSLSITLWTPPLHSRFLFKGESSADIFRGIWHRLHICLPNKNQLVERLSVTIFIVLLFLSDECDTLGDCLSYLLQPCQ